MRKEIKNKNKAEEPSANYGSNRLTFYNSLQEANEAQIEHWRSLTPEERLEEHRVLSLYVFSNYEKYTGNRLEFE